MRDRLNLPEPIEAYLRGYRKRTRKLSPHHMTEELQATVQGAIEQLRRESTPQVHGRLLLLMLYYGTSLLAEELCQLSPHSIRDTREGMLVELPVPDPVPRQIWLDKETAQVMRAYLDRLPFRHERLFENEHGRACTRSDVYHLVTELRDDEEGSKLEHFFPIYHETDYAVVPTPLRLNADPHYTGRGVTIAFIDSGFYPHPDLVKPRNRVRRYVNIADPQADDFGVPGEDSWHGMQTSVSAAGNGYLSKGLYKGIAPDADVVLLKVRGRHGIQTRYIIEALEWCIKHQQEHNIRVINISLSGDRPGSYLRSALDQAAEGAVQAGIIVVVAAGNSGWDQGSETIRPPASAPSVITVGGLNDNNRLDVNAYEMYWSSYGPTLDGILKPEIVAPGIWVAAPILPGTPIYRIAGWIDRLQKASDQDLPQLVREARADGADDLPARLEQASTADIRAEVSRIIKDYKLIPPYYQHVDGTSFSAPIVCSVIAQMLEANPRLTPARVKKILTTTTDKLFNVPIVRQGHGLIHPRKAVKEAANDLHRTGLDRPSSPHVVGRVATFYFRDHRARSVTLTGEFNGWNPETTPMRLVGPDLWSISWTFEEPDIYRYKYVIDGQRWIVDPENLNREPDGYGGYNARVNVMV